VAKCCKTAPAYPQNREYTAHLLIATWGQTGLPPEPGTGPAGAREKWIDAGRPEGVYRLQDEKGNTVGYTRPEPPGLTTAELIALNKEEEKGLAGAAKDAEIIEAAQKEHQKHLK